MDLVTLANNQVLKEEGKKPQMKSHMWLYRIGSDEMHPIILYE